jgi:hypothetical protein
VLESITIDKSGGTAAVIERYNTARVAGIEVMHRITKGQLVTEEGEPRLTPAEQFSSLAAESHTPVGISASSLKICDIYGPASDVKGQSSKP